MSSRPWIRLLTMPVVVGAVVIGSAGAASAAPAPKASCVGQLVNGAFGPPGQEQRQFLEPGLGSGVSFVAQFPQDLCGTL